MTVTYTGARPPYRAYRKKSWTITHFDPQYGFEFWE
jgi:hypothetical protein